MVDREFEANGMLAQYAASADRRGALLGSCGFAGGGRRRGGGDLGRNRTREKGAAGDQVNCLALDTRSNF